MLSSLLFCKITSNSAIHTYFTDINFSFGFERKYRRIDGFGEKKARNGGFVYPYSPPSYSITLPIREYTPGKTVVYWMVQLLHERALDSSR